MKNPLLTNVNEQDFLLADFCAIILKKYKIMAIKIQNSFRAMLIIVLTSIAFQVQAQDWKTDKKVNVVFGLTQVLVKGFNVEGNYIHNRLIFDYSHGVSLEFSGSGLPTDLKRQGLAVHAPWTTGFGVGYRLKEWVNIRVEPKWHRFEFYYDGESQNSANQIVSYNTMSLGIGIYSHYQPFKNSASFLKGITIAPNIRFWPTIASTLKEDKYTYVNKNTLKNEAIKTVDPGIGLTPLIVNVSVGYSFDIKKKK